MINMNVTNRDPEFKLEINGSVVCIPQQIQQYTITTDHVIVVFKGWTKNKDSVFEKIGVNISGKKDRADFKLPQGDRNVVSFTNDGTLEWIIPEAPDGDPDSDRFYFSVYEVQGNIWVRNENGYSYRLDKQTGDIVERIPANHLRFGDTEIEFEGGYVEKLIKYDSVVVVKLDTSQHENPTSRNIYAFTRDGEQLWQVGDNTAKHFPTFTNIFEDDGELWAVNMNGYDYRLDWETGEPLDQEYTG